MSLTIGLVKDGKPGHEKQIDGLINALRQEMDVTCHTIKPLSFFRALRGIFIPNTNHGNSIDFWIGAGHATHLTLLVLKRISKAKIIVLMKPSWPIGLFDLAIIPEHDRVRLGNNVLFTKGVLNNCKPRVNKTQEDVGLFLIGGYSKHYQWNTQALIEQIKQVIANSPQQSWNLTTSRRTPDQFIEQLRLLNENRLNIFESSETEERWLETRLNDAAVTWVTSDSVSMIYETLTTGVDCGIFSLQKNGITKVNVSLDELVEQKQVTLFDQWQKNHYQLYSSRKPLNEAQRCAQYIIQWLKN